MLVSTLFSGWKCFVWLICSFLHVFNDHFVLPKYFWLQWPHGTQYTALWQSKGWTGSFPFCSLSPVVHIGLKMIWFCDPLDQGFPTFFAARTPLSGQSILSTPQKILRYILLYKTGVLKLLVLMEPVKRLTIIYGAPQ